MPSQPTRQTIARQWELLKLLPGRQPGLSCSQLQAALATVGHVTTKRTVERDLVELAALFPLQCNSRSLPYSWHWQPGLKASHTQQWLAEDMAGPAQIELHAWVDDALARDLQQRPVGVGMLLLPQADGGATLVTTVADSPTLMAWLLSQAGSIRVQAPKEIRVAMLDQLRHSLALHEAG
ncbi:WYL domain-containing protein [Pseudomonas parafulva]|uniref:WYL domain-containing protein n=1 Tax=Pseudomonas parafulva TaxID=157782 RepID=UPI0004100043|nr:WYL domain-containing protein [Pseudomonas parafulva]